MLLNPDIYRTSIVSKVIPATDTELTKIKTSNGSGRSKIVYCQYGEEYPQNHVNALVNHATELGWLKDFDYAIGSIPDGFVLVLVPKILPSQSLWDVNDCIGS